jgi:uncharacterized protein (DUF305 family)
VTTLETQPDTATTPAPRAPRSLLVVLAVVTAIALVAAGAGLAVAAGLGGGKAPGDSSVDVGFARDMSTHHVQATEMAQVVRDTGTDPEVRLMAFDIETQQLGQVGQMRGWLDGWGRSPQSSGPQMAWMGHSVEPGGLMPGMATPAEMTKLRSLSGRALDVFFLQLMIKHHRGGLEMAQYGAQHASSDYVRQLADKIAKAQQAEVVTMERMLRARGAQPLS